MAALFTDGCDSYGSTSEITLKWAARGTDIAFNASAGNGGGGGVVFGTTGGNALKTPATFSIASLSPYCKGFFFKASAAPASNARLHTGVQAGGTEIFRLGLTTSGFFARMDGSNNPQSPGTGSINVCDNAFHWIEIKVVPGNGGGSTTGIEVLVDGVSDISVFGNFINDNGPLVQDIFYSIAGITWTLDDLIIYDGTGSTGMLTSAYPYGQLQITTLRPTSDTATVQFATSSGSAHFSLVDSASGSSGNYVQDATSGDVDLYNYADLGFTPSSIKSVILNSCLFSPVGSISAYEICKSSSTQSDGSSISLPNVARVAQRELGLDPATSAAWTATGLNAAQFGVKVA